MKKTLLFIATSVAMLTASAQIPSAGLIAYYSFTGNANDGSGYANNGVVTSATLTTDRFGNANSAYSFNGSSSVITIPSAPILETITNQYSFSVWTKINLFNSGQFSIIDKDTLCPPTSGKTPFLFVADNISNSGYQIQNIACGVSTQFGKAGINAQLNTWTHTVATYDGSNIKFYVNGILKSTTSATGNVSMSKGNLTIGHTVFGAGNSWANGVIDDIRIYNTAITQSDVTALFNEGICVQSLAVTDTLKINLNVTGFNPITFNNQIKIYPNPAVDQLNIAISNFNSINGYQLKITNTLSQTMYLQTITSATYTASLSGYSAGTYIVQVLDGSGNLVDSKKLILQ